MDKFEEACRDASRRNSPFKLRDILNQHVLVMVCAANPNASKKECIQIGQRLAQVQENWIRLLCPLRKIEDHDKNAYDKRYREIARVVITNFTNKLMEMLVDYKVIAYEELENAHVFHSMCGNNNNTNEMKKLFLCYLDSLTCIFNCDESEKRFKARAVDCIYYADLLGAYLDDTIIK